MEKKTSRVAMAVPKSIGLDRVVQRTSRVLARLKQEVGEGVSASIIDGATDETLVELPVESKGGRSGRKVGYSSEFADAWDRMMERRAEREAKGISSSDA